MNFKNLNSFSTSRVKALFGLHPKVLADPLLKLLPELEKRRLQRLAARKDRKRPLLPKEGRPLEVLPIPKVLMTLIYLRHNVSHEVVGSLFGFSAVSSENAFHEVLPLLRDMFPSEKWEAEKKWRRGEPTWTPEEVDRIQIESFETPISRPSINDRQKRVYSGKKKRHPLKTQVMSDQKGVILCVGQAHPGPKADIKIYEEEPVPEPIANQPRMGDKAYSSKDHPERSPGDRNAAEKTEGQRVE